jgi:hypothetical protein
VAITKNADAAAVDAQKAANATTALKASNEAAAAKASNETATLKTQIDTLKNDTKNAATEQRDKQTMLYIGGCTAFLALFIPVIMGLIGQKGEKDKRLADHIGAMDLIELTKAQATLAAVNASQAVAQATLAATNASQAVVLLRPAAELKPFEELHKAPV